MLLLVSWETLPNYYDGYLIVMVFMKHFIILPNSILISFYILYLIMSTIAIPKNLSRKLKRK